MWVINKIPFKTKKELAQAMGCSLPKVHRIIRGYEDNGDPELLAELEEVISEFNFRKDLAELLTNYTGELISPRDVTKPKLHSLGFKVYSVGLGMGAMYRVVYYALKYNFSWLVLREQKPFKFKGMTLSSTNEFYSYFRIIKNSLHREIILHKGDFDKAFLTVKDDPEYMVREIYTIGGVPYESTKAVEEAFGINYQLFKATYRQVQDADKALAICRKNEQTKSEYISRIVPFKYLGTNLKSLAEVSDFLGLSLSYVSQKCKTEEGAESLYCSLMQKTETGDYVAPFKKDKFTRFTTREVNGHNISTPTDLNVYFGIDHIFMNSVCELLNITIEEFYSQFEKFEFNYDGKNFYSLSYLANYLQIDYKTISTFYFKYICSDLSKASKGLLTARVDAIKDILTIGDIRFGSFSSLCRELGIEGKRQIPYYELAKDSFSSLSVKHKLVVSALKADSGNLLALKMKEELTELQYS